MDSSKKNGKARLFAVRFVFTTYPILLLWVLYALFSIKHEPVFSKAEWSGIMETYKTAGQISNELKNFYNDRGEYPVSLIGLVPKYVQKIEPPKTGDTDWLFKVDEKGGFTLEVRYNSYCGLPYPVIHNFVNLNWRREKPEGNN